MHLCFFLLNILQGFQIITWVQHSNIFHLDLRKYVSLIGQQPVHIPNISEVFLVFGGTTNCLVPFLDLSQYQPLNTRVSQCGSLGEPFYQLIQKLLSRNLQVERVSTIFDQIIQQRQGQFRSLWIPLADQLDDSNGCISRC